MAGVSGLSGLSGDSGVFGGAINITYLIQDLFTTDRAAGAVNGTAAEPGPGTRAVTDAANRISISGEELVIVSGGNYADPTFHFTEAMTKQASLTYGLVWYQNGGTTAQLGYAGWDTNSSGELVDVRLQYASTDLYARDGSQFASTYSVDIGDFVVDTTYRSIMICLDTLIVWCIKGGAYADWTMLHKAAIMGQLSNTIYAGINGYNRPLNVKECNVALLPSPWDSDAAVASLNDGDTITGRARSVLDAFFLV